MKNTAYAGQLLSVQDIQDELQSISRETCQGNFTEYFLWRGLDIQKPYKVFGTLYGLFWNVFPYFVFARWVYEAYIGKNSLPFPFTAVITAVVLGVQSWHFIKVCNGFKELRRKESYYKGMLSERESAESE